MRQNNEVLKIRILLLLFGQTFWTFHLPGQVLSPLEVQISDIDGDIFRNPYMGTLTAPQFSETDFNGDGIMDLFVFDRRGDTPLVFLYDESEGYRHAPQYGRIFPKTLHSWAVIKDFNGDGIGDIFTAPIIAGIPGIEVFVGNREGNSVFYTLLDLPNEFNALEYPSGNNQIIVYVAFSDYPGIEDIDSDGDIDVITFDPGGAIARLYRNYAVERHSKVDTFDMELEDLCWGKFKENDFSSELTLSTDPNICSTGFRGIGQVRHSGSTLSFIDKNRDGVHDLLLGDLSNQYISFLENTGNNIDAWMTKLDVTFPSYNVPMAVEFFSGTFAVDINKDGKKDILVAPNSRLANPTSENIWYYEDEGIDTASFSLKQKNFILDNSLVMGGFSSPALIDIDLDGDMDLLVGVRGLKSDLEDVEGAVYLFENISADNELRYKIKNDDYLSLRSVSSESGSYAPAVGDLDGDSDMDIIIGDREGKLLYFENHALPGQIPVFNDFIYEFQGIDVGQNAKPQVFDLNKDGLADLIVGERNDNKEGLILGGVNLFLNIGSVNNPLFDPSTASEGNTSVLGGIFTRDPGVSVGSSSPWLFISGSKIPAIVGSESGSVKMYDDLIDNFYGQAMKVNDNILPFNIGGNTTITGGNLNGNNLLDIVVGSNMGSLYFFETSYEIENSVASADINSIEFKLLPNPSKGEFTIQSSDNIDQIRIFDIQGRMVHTASSKNVSVSLPDGIYFLTINSGNKAAIEKMVIVND